MWSSLPSIGIVEIDLSLANLNGLLQMYLHGLVPETLLESFPQHFEEHIELEEKAIRLHGCWYPEAHQKAHEQILKFLGDQRAAWKTEDISANEFVTSISSAIAQHVNLYDVELKKGNL